MKQHKIQIESTKCYYRASTNQLLLGLLSLNLLYGAADGSPFDAAFTSVFEDFEAKNDKEAIEKANKICDERHNQIIEDFEVMLGKAERTFSERRWWEFIQKREAKKRIRCLEHIRRLARGEKCCVLYRVSFISHTEKIVWKINIP